MPKKRVHRKLGDVVSIPLGDGLYGFGRVLPEPRMAFYDLQARVIPKLKEILSSPVIFNIAVMRYASRLWPVIGNEPLDEKLLIEPLFFKKDIVSGKLTIYRDSTGEEIPATKEQCEKLECAAVWDPEHIVDRLVDHFAERPNTSVESMRP